MFGEYDQPSNNLPMGIVLALLLHFFQIVLGPPTEWYSLMYIGVSQLLYLLPAMALCHRNQRDDIVKGLIIGAALTFLLNASCTAIFWGFP